MLARISNTVVPTALIIFSLPFVSCLLLGCNRSDGRSLVETHEGVRYIKKDLPAIVEGEQLTLLSEFPFKNDTGRHLTLKCPFASCSCTASRLDQQELLPGEQTVLRIEANLKGRQGKQRFTSTVEEEAAGDKWVFEVTTEIIPLFTLIPNRYSFDDVRPRQDYVTRLLFTSHHRTPDRLLKLLAANTHEKMLSANIGEDDAAGPTDDQVVTRVWHVDLTLHAGIEFSGQTSMDLLYKDSEGQVNTYRVPVSWNIANPYLLDPPRVFFGGVASGAKPLSREVLITRKDGSPFSIHSVASSSPSVTVTCATGQSSSHVLTVKYDPVATNARLFGHLLVDTSDSGCSPIRIPFAAFKARPSPTDSTELHSAP